MFLGVNVDHVATVREDRKDIEPDPVKAVTLSIKGGSTTTSSSATPRFWPHPYSRAMPSIPMG